MQRSDVPFRSALAERLLAQSLQTSGQPVQSAGEGLAKMGTVWANALNARKLREKDEAETEARGAELAAALSRPDPTIQGPQTADQANREARIAALIGNNPRLQDAAAQVQLSNMIAPKERFEPVTDAKGNIVGQRSTTTGQVFADPRHQKPRESRLMTPEEEAQKIRIARATKNAETGGQGVEGPFAGKGMPQQIQNVLLNPNADTSAPTYHAAYNLAAQPRATMGADGSVTVVKPDMSAYRPPTPRGAPQASVGPVPRVTPPPISPASPDSNIVSETKFPGGSVTKMRGSIPPKLKDARAAGAGIVGALNDYTKSFNDAGVGERVASVAGFNTELNTGYNKAALLTKSEDLFNLGVLNGPDLELIRRILPDPSTIKGNASGAGEAKKAAESVKKLLIDRINAKERQEGLPLSTEADLLGGDAATETPPGDIPAPPPGFVVDK